MTNDSNPPTITEFLLARIAEDESVAKAAIPPGRACTDGPLRWGAVSQAIGDATGYVVAYDIPGAAPRNHIARHDPARVLRECAAKRAIIEQAEVASDDREQLIGEFCAGMAESAKGYATDPGKLILEALAAVYSDHPDYNPEWSL